ncbi:hypothetical protein Q3V23_19050 [Streptomyces sp. VNUA116]|uniref:hypothetical protein n=1 Tax=Streptomyces sp. VNUA116 TaxID=3062449 RepID=UPI00267531E5|nr:hypothetical protein [Streptomyces sp. VNUA116]WKU45988.1 hypothetical protein Q3V23_19050 [Streptomyces sp. VNUA116]
MKRIAKVLAAIVAGMTLSLAIAVPAQAAPSDEEGGSLLDGITGTVTQTVKTVGGALLG